MLFSPTRLAAPLASFSQPWSASHFQFPSWFQGAPHHCLHPQAQLWNHDSPAALCDISPYWRQYRQGRQIRHRRLFYLIHEHQDGLGAGKSAGIYFGCHFMLSCSWKIQWKDRPQSRRDGGQSAVNTYAGRAWCKTKVVAHGRPDNQTHDEYCSIVISFPGKESWRPGQPPASAKSQSAGHHAWGNSRDRLAAQRADFQNPNGKSQKKIFSTRAATNMAAKPMARWNCLKSITSRRAPMVLKKRLRWAKKPTIKPAASDKIKGACIEPGPLGENRKAHRFVAAELGVNQVETNKT